MSGDRQPDWREPVGPQEQRAIFATRQNQPDEILAAPS